MKNRILLFFLLAGVSVLLIFFSQKITGQKSIMPNGFERTFYTSKLQLLANIPIPRENYFLAGLDLNQASLYKFHKPFELLNVNFGLKNIREHKIQFIEESEKADGLNKVKLIGTDTFLLAGRSSKAYRINGKGKVIKDTKLDFLPFYQSEVLNANSFVLVTDTIVDRVKRRILINVDWSGNHRHSYLPTKQKDGYFCTDGYFAFDGKTKTLVYMYYYRGEFTSLDSNLNIIYNSKTIDTIKHAKLSIKSIGSMITLATPPDIVNKRLCVANGKIFINSNVRAENESEEKFRENAIIDVYGLKNGRYISSFYIPMIKNQIINEFAIFNNVLVILYNGMLSIYKAPGIVDDK